MREIFNLLLVLDDHIINIRLNSNYWLNSNIVRIMLFSVKFTLLNSKLFRIDRRHF